MSTRIPVVLSAPDPISRAGLAAALRGQQELWLVEGPDVPSAAVGIAVLDRWSEAAVGQLRALRSTGCESAILVIAELSDTELLSAVEAGVCALVWRAEATAQELGRVVRQVASGNGALPSDVLGRLLRRVSRLQRDVLAPIGLDLTGLSPREANVLRLMAQGKTTHEIAAQLSYSVRTVTNILHDVTTRFHLTNRTHAVAFALQEGLI